MRIAIDAMGGDFAPKETVAGVLMAAQDVDAELILVGNPELLGSHLGDGHPRVVVEPARDVIAMGESPRKALRGRDDASVVRAVGLVADGSAQAVVSAGNSGALMALAATRMGTIPGVSRPAIAINFPAPSGRQVLLDAGANADCKPEYLRDFALMGSVYAECGLGIANPRVGIMSIGEEKGKGNELTKAAYELLEATDMNFIGNVEGRDAFADTCDVIVCDGFVGNVILKTAERAAQVLYEKLSREINASLLLKLVSAPMRHAFGRVANEFDYSATGGALLLGVNGVAIVCHGSSDARAISNAVRFAHHAVEHRLTENVVNLFAARQPMSAPLEQAGAGP